MTRQEIQARVQDVLGEPVGSQGAPSVLGLSGLINAAADEIARATDCYAASFGTDLVAGQSLYGAPHLYRVRGAFWTDPNLNKIQLQLTTNPELDDRFSNLATSAGWRNAPQGDPIYYSTKGDNSIVLYPTPDTSTFVAAISDLAINASNQYMVSSAGTPFTTSVVNYTLRITAGTNFNTGIYTILAVDGSGNATLDQPAGSLSATAGTSTLSTGGLYIEGFKVPGDCWSSPTSVCPLPERAHIAVVWRVAILRCIQYPSPENQARLPLLRDEYIRQKGLLAKETALLTDATSHGDHQRFPFGGGYY